ncbi:MAG: Xaa-Pro peptidase family protein [Thermoanaerobaculum sp.]|nr:Xaa-Pro peptidase family protein [Thermoanaerobaculum sp.]
MIDQRQLMGGHYAAALEAPAVYRGRRQKVVEAVGEGGVAVLLGARDARGYGDVGTFRQEPNFFYLSGVEIPNAALILGQGRDELYLPARRPALEAWLGPRFGPGEEAAQALGFAQVKDVQGTEVVVEARRRPVPGFEDFLAALLASGKELWICLPPPSSSAPLTPEQDLVARLRQRLAHFAVRDLSPVLTSLRLRKSSGELQLLQRAVEITASAIKAVASTLAPGVTEAHLEGVAYAELRRQGAEGWSFPPIVGSGSASCVLHYDHNLGTCGAGELVVVDLGARFGYYCGDLTRTLPVSGTFTPRQRELYQAVLAAYEAAVARIRPGATLGELRHAAYESLRTSGVTDRQGVPVSEYFLHGIGHFLGLEAHDAGAESQVLEPGMVITVEPGVYLPDELVGIRIEDDYLVTEEGARCLTPSWLPREAEAVAALVGQGR